MGDGMTTTDMQACPFCGSELRPKNEYGHYVHPAGGCFLSEYEFDDDSVSDWNKRPSRPNAQAEEMVRFCPSCGSVGDVPATFRDCCPDGSNARIVPKGFAEICADTFQLAVAPQIEAIRDAQADERGAFQSRVHPWMLACFGSEIAADTVERNHRFFEEAAELVQACGMTASEAHQLVDYTWSRPVGEKSQEVGGVMVTLAALCLSNGLDMHAAGETELARISAPETMAKIRAKQAAKPKHSPLPEVRAAAPQAEAAQGVPAAIDLQGLREKLLAPRNVARDANGWLTHPDYPVCDEGTRADKFLEAFGIETAFIPMELDSPDLYDRRCEEGLTNCSDWTPTPPKGGGWLILEIYDTEDGPFAMFGRDAYAAERERKKERTRKLRAAVDAVRAERNAAPDRVRVGEVPECCGTPAYCSSVRRCTAKDASSSRECPHGADDDACKACYVEATTEHGASSRECREPISTPHAADVKRHLDDDECNPSDICAGCRCKYSAYATDGGVQAKGRSGWEGLATTYRNMRDELASQYGTAEDQQAVYERYPDPDISVEQLLTDEQNASSGEGGA